MKNEKNYTTQELTLIYKGEELAKRVCKTYQDAHVFKRDMPAVFGLLFSGLPYTIKTKYLG